MTPHHACLGKSQLGCFKHSQEQSQIQSDLRYNPSSGNVMIEEYYAGRSLPSVNSYLRPAAELALKKATYCSQKTIKMMQSVGQSR